MLAENDFKEAMSRFASGVTIVITAEGGSQVGFTATSFCSLSIEPRLALVCLARSADCFAAFGRASHFTINYLGSGQQEIAKRFAMRGADKFAGLQLEKGQVTELPLVPGAVAQLECRMYAQHEGGDHIILVGEVLSVISNGTSPMVHFGRTFGTFSPIE